MIAGFLPNVGSTRCRCYYSPLVGRGANLTNRRVFVGELSAVVHLSEEMNCSPSNIWPEDLFWFVYTDSDAMATKFSGTNGLIAHIERNGELETLHFRG